MTMDPWDRVEPAPGPAGSDPGGVSLWSIAMGAKWRILPGAVMAAILTYGALTQVAPLYEAETQVMLEVAPAPVIDIPNVVADQVGNVATLQSALIVMRSSDVMRAVVTELDLTTRAEFNPALRTPGPLDRAKAAIRALLPAEDDDVAAPRDPVSRTARVLRETVATRVLGESLIIEISAQSQNAALSAAIANEVAEQYILKQIELKTIAADRATAWLEDRTDELRRELEAAEARVSEARRAVIDVGQSVSTDLERQISELTAQIGQLTLQRDELAAQRTELTQLSDSENYVTLAAAAALPGLTAMIEQLSQLDRQVIELRAQYGDHPKTREVLATRAQLEQQLQDEIGRVLSGLDVRINVLDDRLDALDVQLRETRGGLLDSRGDDLSLQALEREAEASRDVYDRFALRLKDVRERSLFQSPGARIVSAAERPSDPVSPQKASGAVLGGVGGGALVLALLAFFRRPSTAVTRADEVHRLTGVGHVQPIPLMPRAATPLEMLRLMHRPKGANLDSVMRWFQLRLMPKTHKWSTLIVVTSVEEGDGKSSLSLLLSDTFAANDYSTVLINADPTGGGLAGLGQTRDYESLKFGFLDYSEDAMRIVERHVAVESSLHDRKENILNADVIIVDAQAMPMSSRMVEIGQMADHVIVACSWNQTSRTALQQCVSGLREVGVAVSAVALNRMPAKALPPLRRVARAAPRRIASA
ncbi:exopolysaccharide transport family protein [Oceaniglobus indicus]|uniref:exopolysaccharide transport family protein n=1 Tax=Oceaniglobus indicus TaxID=2047749 RepID=UPI0011AB6DEC|nr:exopolysaccharide transport family protein [Oceaniglobus indicus]